MSKLNFFASGHSPAMNNANKKDLPEQVKQNDDKYKNKDKK